VPRGHIDIAGLALAQTMNDRNEPGFLIDFPIFLGSTTQPFD
jgi:hypothetical protein